MMMKVPPSAIICSALRRLENASFRDAGATNVLLVPMVVSGLDMLQGLLASTPVAPALMSEVMKYSRFPIQK